MTLRLITALALLAFVASRPACAQQTIHGADSLFVAPTVKIAWAVRKGASEDATTIVIRVVNSTRAYHSIRLHGVDPFSKNRKVLVPVRPVGEQVDLTVPRVGFVDFPSCEIHLYGGDATLADDVPSLIVYYLGVPDSTPEFSTAEAMDAYLDKMLAAAKHAP